MKIINKIFLIIISLCFLFSTTANLNIKHLALASNNSCSEIVVEVNSKRILYEKNAYEKKFMASTTKILTAIVIIENCNLSDIVTVTEKTVGIEGSSIYLEAGEKLSVKDLLYGLMLRSGNDCAETLAVFCSNTIDDFAKLMNFKAKEIGANNSNFVNPHGLHDDNHYTTAFDLALISSYAIKNPVFKEIVSTKSTKIPFSTRDYDRHITNKNKMLRELEGATGIKTGYTKKAGRCLVTSCCRNGMEIVSVVLNCPPMFEKSKQLINQAFMDYSNYKIIESDNIIDFIKINNSSSECGIYIKNDVILPLTKNEFNNINIVYDYPKTINYKPNNNEEIGNIKIYCQNNLLFTEKIYTIV